MPNIRTDLTQLAFFGFEDGSVSGWAADPGGFPPSGIIADNAQAHTGTYSMKVTIPVGSHLGWARFPWSISTEYLQFDAWGHLGILQNGLYGSFGLVDTSGNYMELRFTDAPPPNAALVYNGAEIQVLQFDIDFLWHRYTFEYDYQTGNAYVWRDSVQYGGAFALVFGDVAAIRCGSHSDAGNTMYNWFDDITISGLDIIGLPRRRRKWL